MAHIGCSFSCDVGGVCLGSGSNLVRKVQSLTWIERQLPSLSLTEFDRARNFTSLYKSEFKRLPLEVSFENLLLHKHAKVPLSLSFLLAIRR